MTKSVIKHLIYGIAGGCVFFVAWIIVMDLAGADRLQESFENVTIYALGFIVMASGFSMSAIVYDIDRLAMWLKIVVNVFVGFGIFFLVGHTTGLISLESLTNIVIYVVTAVILFIAVCFGDYLFNRREAKAINKKLKEDDSDDSSC